MASRIVLPFALPSCLQLDLKPGTWLSHHLRGGVPPFNRPLGSLACPVTTPPGPISTLRSAEGSFISCLPTSSLSESVVTYEAGNPRFLSGHISSRAAPEQEPNSC